MMLQSTVILNTAAVKTPMDLLREQTAAAVGRKTLDLDGQWALGFTLIALDVLEQVRDYPAVARAHAFNDLGWLMLRKHVAGWPDSDLSSEQTREDIVAFAVAGARAVLR